MTAPDDSLSVDEAAAPVIFDEVQFIDLTCERLWCDACLKTSVVPWSRFIVTIDQDGAVLSEHGPAFYCVEHDDFVEVGS